VGWLLQPASMTATAAHAKTALIECFILPLLLSLTLQK
jgi:hypothetical protein